MCSRLQRYNPRDFRWQAGRIQRLPFSSGREGSIEYYPEIDLIVCLEASFLD